MPNRQYLLTTYILLLVLWGSLSATWAQQLTFANQVNKLNIILTPVRTEAQLTESQRNKLETILAEWLVQKGVVSSPILNGLVLTPFWRVVDERIINPGLQTLTVVSGELTLTLRQADNAVLFGAITRKLQSSGRTREVALNMLFDQFDSNDSDLNQFLEHGKQKCMAYYSRDCANLIQQANRVASVRQYEQALGLLLSIPQETDCYDKAQQHLQAIFTQYQQRVCAGLLQTARAQVAGRNFIAALTTISQLDPQSPCAADARVLIDQAVSQTSSDNQQRWTVLRQLFGDSRSLQQYRFQLLEGLLSRYYLTNPRVWGR